MYVELNEENLLEEVTRGPGMVVDYISSEDIPQIIRLLNDLGGAQRKDGISLKSPGEKKVFVQTNKIRIAIAIFNIDLFIMLRFDFEYI